MPIRAEGRFTFFDLWFGSMFHSRRTIKIVGGIASVVLLIAVLEVITDRASWQNQEPIVGLSVMWILLLPVWLLYPCYRNLKRSPNLRGLITYDFTEEGYDLNATHSQSRVQWSALVKWREGKRCFLLYPGPRVASIIPKRFFQNPADIDSLRLILQAKVPRK